MLETKLGEFEEVILLLVGILEEEAYAYHIARVFEDETGRKVSIGATHSALKRLEGKGFLSSSMSDPFDERGGRRRRIFKVTAYGVKTLKEAQALRLSLWKQFPGLSTHGI